MMLPGERTFLETLQREVVLRPHDRDAAGAYLREFEQQRPGDGGEPYEISLVLKYFHDPGTHEHLNRLGDHYVSEKKKFLAALCFLESIRLEPMQPEIYKKYEVLKGHLEPETWSGSSAGDDVVSVIMATYNRGSGILESVESVLGQTVQDFELIVVNDGGDPGVEGLLNSLRSDKIRYVRLPGNHGHAAALNEGVRRSRGRYIAYLDDDDLYYPNHLESLLAILKRDGRKVAYSNTRMVTGTEKNGRFHASGVKGQWRVAFDRNKLADKNFLSNLCVMHQKEIFGEIGLFREDLRVVMDWELWLRAALAYDFSHLDAYTGEYRFRERNVTGTKRLWIDFYTEMIGRYYAYYRGAVALARYFRLQKMEAAARDLFSRLTGEYDAYFRSPESAPDLLELSAHFGDRAFSRKVSGDYFTADARDFLRYVRRTSGIGLILSVLPMVPAKLAAMLRRRIP
jgi:glycosyltransferase involved in cell wall biosynthesis